MPFPKDFAWGAATASFQIEGSTKADEKGESVWDAFTQKQKSIWNNHHAEKACDHYRLYDHDVELMGSLGLKAYRFSISWPRVLPHGKGKPNQAGIDFYSRLVDKLLEKNIQPWLNPDSPKWFGDYAKLMGEKLSDRVENWFTFNEPSVFILLGHQNGLHAPGVQFELRDILQMIHHVHLAHGLGVQNLRSTAKGRMKIGLATNGIHFFPSSESESDILAAKEAFLSAKGPNLWNNTWWTDPIFLGKYPQDGWESFGKDVPKISPTDMKNICQPLDFCAFNGYFGTEIKSDPTNGFKRLPFSPTHPKTAFDWYVTPEFLRWSSRFFYERYKLPIVVSENGMSNIDWVDSEGKVRDPQRMDYLKTHLLQLQKAMEEGVPVQGYFLWTLMDNFEWAEGYRQRFGQFMWISRIKKERPNKAPIIILKLLPPTAKPSPNPLRSFYKIIPAPTVSLVNSSIRIRLPVERFL